MNVVLNVFKDNHKDKRTTSNDLIFFIWISQNVFVCWINASKESDIDTVYIEINKRHD